MPMIPEAVFAILACARLGAIHSVVFGGFAAASLAARIDDARPALMVTADGGSRMGKTVLYKPLVDESLKLAKHPPKKVLIYRPRARPERCPSSRGATSTGTTLAQGLEGASVAVRVAGIERAVVHPLHLGHHRASRKACSATSAATRSRSRRR